MLKKRIITSVCGIPLIIAAVWFENPLPWLTVLVVLLGLVAAFEFFRLFKYAVTIPLTVIGLLCVLLFTLSPYCDYRYTAPILTAAAAVLPALWLAIRPRQQNKTAAWVWTVVGILYIGWLISHFILLRGLDNGRNWVFFALFVTFASDTTAYLVGRSIGRHHLAPRISPNKTWEGAAGGLAGAVLVSLLFTLPTPLALPLSYGEALLLGLLVSVMGQLGDLLESWFKRRAGVKDSGRLLPGHGGALDRMDSVIITGATVFYYAVFFVGA